MEKYVIKNMAQCTRNEVARNINKIEQNELIYKQGCELIEIKTLWNDNRVGIDNTIKELETIAYNLVYANNRALNLITDIRVNKAL